MPRSPLHDRGRRRTKTDDPKRWIALITAALSLLGTVFTAWAGARDRRDLEILKDDLQSRRERQQAAAKAEQVYKRYRDPLMHAVYDLQSRCHNIVAQDFLGYLRRGTPAQRDYAVENTVFVIAQYLGWTELIRQEVQFLDPGDDRTRELRRLRDGLTHLLASDAPRYGRRLQVFAGDQRAIGELMIERPAEQPARCIGYAVFRLRRPPALDDWLNPLREDLRTLADDAAPDTRRLVALQRTLIERLDVFDPRQLHFPVDGRTKLEDG
jgi:hypothetical protein